MNARYLWQFVHFSAAANASERGGKRFVSSQIACICPMRYTILMPLHFPVSFGRIKQICRLWLFLFCRFCRLSFLYGNGGDVRADGEKKNPIEQVKIKSVKLFFYFFFNLYAMATITTAQAAMATAFALGVKSIISLLWMHGATYCHQFSFICANAFSLISHSSGFRARHG